MYNGKNCSWLRGEEHEKHEKVYTPVHTVKEGIQVETEKKIFTKKREAYKRMNVHSIACGA
jgi:hypothetical protein